MQARCVSEGYPMQCGSDGISAAEIAIVAEFPGVSEIQNKRPLVGYAGTQLWNVLQRYGLARRNLYVTNVVKRQVIMEKGAKKSVAEAKATTPPAKSEIAFWNSLLMWELAQLPNLKYIVALGSYPLEAITLNSGITNWRGSVVPVNMMYFNGETPTTRTVQVLCANNPAAFVREPRLEVPFKMDMGKLNKLINGEFPPHEIEYLINPTFKDSIDWLKKMRSDKKPTTFDIECLGVGSPETVCIGVTNDAHIGMCINFRNAEDNQFTLSEEIQLWQAFQELFGDTEMQFVAQNGAFDMLWLWFKNRLRVHKLYFDTLLAHHTLYPTLPHNLSFLTSQYTTIPFYKDDGQTWKIVGGDINEEWKYNIKDLCATHGSFEHLIQELHQQDMADFFFNHVMRLQPHLVRMSATGVKLDISKKDQLAAELTVDVHNLLEDFHTKVAIATNDPEYKPNPASPKQMSELYFTKLKLIGKGQSIDVYNRTRMRDHVKTTDVAIAVIDAHKAWAEQNKFNSTYAKSKIDVDGRVRCDWKQYGTTEAPGRLSSSQTLWGSGGNQQNVPRRAEYLYIADGPSIDAPEGYMFVYFDKAQIEARIVAWLADIPAWIEQFEQARIDGKYDAHRALAATMYNKPYDEIPQSDYNEDGTHSIRYFAKRCRHGLNYRMQAHRLAETLHIAVRVANGLYHTYHKVNPEIKVWWEKTIKEAQTCGELYTPLGRRWKLLERFDENAIKSVIAFRPQSTAGDSVASTIYECHEDPRWPKLNNDHLYSAIVLNIHDALIALCRIEDHKLCMKIMREHTEKPIMINNKPLIVPADFKVSVPDENGVHRRSGMMKISNFDEYVNS